MAALDPAPVGQLAAALMDTIERDYHGREVSLRAAIVIVDIGAIDAEGDMWTAVRWHFGERAENWDPLRCSSAYAAGLVAEAFEGLVSGEDDMTFGDDED